MFVGHHKMRMGWTEGEVKQMKTEVQVQVPYDPTIGVDYYDGGWWANCGCEVSASLAWAIPVCIVLLFGISKFSKRSK